MMSRFGQLPDSDIHALVGALVDEAIVAGAAAGVAAQAVLGAHLEARGEVARLLLAGRLAAAGTIQT